MKLSMTACKQAVQPLVTFQGVHKLEHFFRRKDKVVFVMGATGTGKSRLAIDLATRFPAEIINSDKMQVYKGLDIVTNKVTEEECHGVPHHLLGIIEPNANFTATDFRNHASLAIESILSRDRLPIIAGGSSSYIKALVNGDAAEFQLRYECFFLWVDVSLPVLHSFVSERVDRMVELGLVEEVKQMFDPQADYSRGIRRAIGVPELDQYIRAGSLLDHKIRAKLLEAAINKIKENTCNLSCRQLQKIHRLNDVWNWNMHRIDATEVFLKRGEEADEAWEKLVMLPSTMTVRQFLNDVWNWNMHRIDATEVFLKRGEEADEAWEKLVMLPSTMTVRQFLYDEDRVTTMPETAPAIVNTPPVPIPTAVAAATR